MDDHTDEIATQLVLFGSCFIHMRMDGDNLVTEIITEDECNRRVKELSLLKFVPKNTPPIK